MADTVKFIHVTLEKDEMDKLTAIQRKQMIMITSIMRDLLMIQRFLLVASQPRHPHKIEESAFAATSHQLLVMLCSKIHEALEFYRQEGLLKPLPGASAQYTAAQQAIHKLRKRKNDMHILNFIRNKFGFHYDTRQDLDPKIDAVFNSLNYLDTWLSEGDSGNEIFVFTNDVITETIYREMKNAGFGGNRLQFIEKLYDIGLEGASILTHFSRGSLVEVFPVTWTERKSDETELQATPLTAISIPPIICRGS